MEIRSPLPIASTLSCGIGGRRAICPKTYDAADAAEIVWNTWPRGWLSRFSAVAALSAAAGVSGCHAATAEEAGAALERNRWGIQRSRVNHATTQATSRRNRHPSLAMHPMVQLLRSGADTNVVYLGPLDERSLCMRSIECTMNSVV
jgi:hypothetical protein